MIPTIRSMIVATLLTVTVLVGGFGLFAAFRVNHEPLARLPVASTQFQLASVDSAPRVLNFAADQPHLESNDALRAVANAVSEHDPAPAEAVAPPAAASPDAVASTASATESAAPEHVAVASAPEAAQAAPADRPASPPPPEVAAADAAPHEPAPPSEAAPQQKTEAAAEQAAEKEPVQRDKVVTPAADAPAAAAASPSETTQPAPVVAVTGSITEMPPQEAAPPTLAKRAVPKQPQETARQIANRKRLAAAMRRVRRGRIAPRAQPTDQFSGFGQANFQSTSGFQSAQSDRGGGFGAPSAAARRQNTRTQ